MLKVLYFIALHVKRKKKNLIFKIEKKKIENLNQFCTNDRQSRMSTKTDAIKAPEQLTKLINKLLPEHENIKKQVMDFIDQSKSIFDTLRFIKYGIIASLFLIFVAFVLIIVLFVRTRRRWSNSRKIHSLVFFKHRRLLY